jgi:hypothetical protein
VACGAVVGLAVESHSAMLTWHVGQPRVKAIDHVGTAAVATMHNIMRELCGADWRPTEVWSGQARPADAGPFHRFLRVPLRFDAER